MVRARGGAWALLVVVVALAQPAAAQKPKKSAGKAPLPRFKVVEVEGDEVRVISLKARKKSKLPPRAKRLLLSGETRYVLHSKGKTTTLTPEQGKERLKQGTKIRVETDAEGKVKVVHLGSGKKAKRPKKKSS